jgi:sec-independent protein translocase protein TatA
MIQPDMMWALGGTELIIILALIILLFGGRKIPELIKGIGKGIREFKEAKNDKKENAGTSDKT